MEEDIYKEFWEKEEQEKEKKLYNEVISKLPKGKPRQGIKGVRLQRIKKW